MMSLEDELPGYEVQTRFDPELIQPGNPVDLVVTVLPVGHYDSNFLEILEQKKPTIMIGYILKGFNYETDDPTVLPTARFTYVGKEMEQRIPLVAGERVVGTEYSEVHYFNTNLQHLIQGHIAPGPLGAYVQRPGDSSNFPRVNLDWY